MSRSSGKLALMNSSLREYGRSYKLCRLNSRNSAFLRNDTRPRMSRARRIASICRCACGNKTFSLSKRMSSRCLRSCLSINVFVDHVSINSRLHAFLQLQQCGSSRTLSVYRSVHARHCSCSQKRHVTFLRDDLL